MTEDEFVDTYARGYADSQFGSMRPQEWHDTYLQGRIRAVGMLRRAAAGIDPAAVAESHNWATLGPTPAKETV